MFSVLSAIFFFSFITSMAFYLGWMQWLVSKIGWFFQITIGTTPCESMNAAANILLGQTEAPLTIKPFLSQMTPSELHCVMASGMATIAGSVLFAYIKLDISASHLLRYVWYIFHYHVYSQRVFKIGKKFLVNIDIF